MDIQIDVRTTKKKMKRGGKLMNETVDILQNGIINLQREVDLNLIGEGIKKHNKKAIKALERAIKKE